MSNTNIAASQASRQTRWLVIGLIGLVAFFASYRFAQAQSPTSADATTVATGTAPGLPTSGAGAGGGGCCGGGGAKASGAAGQPGASASGAAPAGGGGCCGGGAGGPKVSKPAAVAGSVQKISVDLSTGSYNPSEIVLKAGVPAEITFGQGSGCLGQVQSQDLGFFEDLSSGPKTVKVPALKAGNYSFTCGMGMVSGSIVVK